MRVGVVRKLIDELRHSGYPGYTELFNDAGAVEQRMKDMYLDKYTRSGGAETEDADGQRFVPLLVRQAAEKAYRAKLQGTSLIFDKNATPAEPLSGLDNLERQLRPLNLVAHRSTAGSSTVHAEHSSILAKYQTLEVTTGGVMLNQFLPQYLGTAYPFTMPVAVGGYDVPGKARWRRPAAGDLDVDGVRECIVQLDEPFWKHEGQSQVPAATVDLFDLV